MKNPLPLPTSTPSTSATCLPFASSYSTCTLPTSRMNTVASSGDLARSATAMVGASVRRAASAVVVASRTCRGPPILEGGSVAAIDKPRLANQPADSHVGAPAAIEPGAAAEEHWSDQRVDDEAGAHVGAPRKIAPRIWRRRFPATRRRAPDRRGNPAS